MCRWNMVHYIKPGSTFYATRHLHRTMSSCLQLQSKNRQQHAQRKWTQPVLAAAPFTLRYCYHDDDHSTPDVEIEITVGVAFGGSVSTAGNAALVVATFVSTQGLSGGKGLMADGTLVEPASTVRYRGGEVGGSVLNLIFPGEFSMTGLMPTKSLVRGEGFVANRALISELGRMWGRGRVVETVALGTLSLGPWEGLHVVEVGGVGVGVRVKVEWWVYKEVRIRIEREVA
ncbi:hypothetical protein G2W53_031412 [Senna tora]|uniref:Uncharacterized protein n=1 Tax=Senna tora TaxID=362788 RepID=A0A834WDY4_9FABA|nr:hypothetical protein G2W53_031412 [Senna tora]